LPKLILRLSGCDVLQDDDDDDDEEDDDDDDEEQEQRADDATAGTGEGDWAVKDLDAESVDSEVRRSSPILSLSSTLLTRRPSMHRTLTPYTCPPPSCLDHTRAQALRRAQGDKDALELAAKLLVQRRVRVPRSHFPRHHRSLPLTPKPTSCTAA
jgi:hypothetical protein